MASRTMSAIFGITVCFFLVCIVNTTTAEVTTTLNHSETSENSLFSTAAHSAETTLSPALNVTNTTLSNEKTTPLNVSGLSQFSTSTAASTTQSTVNVSGSSTLKDNATSSSHSSSIVPLTGHSTTILPGHSTNNQTYSTKTSGVTRVVSTPLPTQTKPTPQYNGNETTPNGTASTGLSDAEKNSMKYSEIILTSIFSAILVVVVLVILSFGLKRCLRGKFQYSHHPLRETSYEPADSYSPPDDTLVISGGLYDAPRIYNPNMTVLEEEESQNDYASFHSRSGQFRLEFLPGDKDMDPVFNGSQTRNV